MRRKRCVERLKAVNLPRDLAFQRQGASFTQAAQCDVLRKADPALIDHVEIFLFQLDKDRLIRPRGMIAPQAQLLLIHGPLQRAPDQAVIVRVEIDVPYRRAPIAVQTHIRVHCGKHRFLLRRREKVLELVALKH